MLKLNCNKDAIKKATEISGGKAQFALKLGVSYQCVLNWIAGKTNPNKFNCINIEKVTDGKVSRKDIFPHYPWDENDHI